ncbi:START domain-containing protein 10-like [Gigantopelta aegis]|uniref:START domain-containing protein 10-like n=1 Tax=Gigantopelta aegis TaxID=1735272 RepID=UPI001B88C7FD|nr:START domain-containing protein 10-like [Gigantopelta aegis]
MSPIEHLWDVLRQRVYTKDPAPANVAQLAVALLNEWRAIPRATICYYASKYDLYLICVINPNNDIGYYAIKCPPPLRNRDFVTQRSWLETGSEYYIINHSVNHENCPPRKGFIRGISFFTGYYIVRLANNSCQMTYVSQSDPKGKLPSWAMNKLTHIMAPKVISRVYKACKKYHSWKSKHNPHFKPWLNAEQMMSNLPRFNPENIKAMKLSLSSESLLEDGELNEEDVNDDDL